MCLCYRVSKLLSGVDIRPYGLWGSTPWEFYMSLIELIRGTRLNTIQVDM